MVRESTFREQEMLKMLLETASETVRHLLLELKSERAFWRAKGPTLQAEGDGAVFLTQNFWTKVLAHKFRRSKQKF